MALAKFPPGLYVAATPIGHLSDITDRVRHALAVCDLIYSEDTRRAHALINGLHISRPEKNIHALHDHNEAEVAKEVVRNIKEGMSVLLISDAGTPGISDPGAVVVDTAWKAGVLISPLPGASALTAILSICGFARWPISFHGFAPAKKSARCEWLKSILALRGLAVIFEAPHRAGESLKDCAEIFGDQTPMAAARELTKQFETIHRGTISQVQEMISQKTQADPSSVKGEMVWAFDLGDKPELSADDETLCAWAETLSEEMPKAKAARILAKMLHVDRDRAYQALMDADKKN